MSTVLARRISTVAAASTPSVPLEPAWTHHLKLLQVWQWTGWPYNFEGALDLCEDMGYTGLLVKALDGKYWMGDIETSPIAVGSVRDCHELWQIAFSRGLYLMFWTNPRQADWQAQANITADIALATDGVLLDIEPYDQFWGAWAPEGLAKSFMEAIRARAPGAYVGLQPDPRTNALASLRIAEWLDLADGMWGQHYWSDFGTSPQAELAQAKELGNLFAIPVLPTVPGNYQGVWPLDEISEFPGFAVWRAGSTPVNTLIALGSVPVAGLETTKIGRRP